MNIIHFFVLSTLISLTTHTMHFKNGSTNLHFNGQNKSIREWIGDKHDDEFGNTPIITTTTNTSPFKKTGTVNTLTAPEFELIIKGYAFYCSNIKKKNDIAYGAIVINPTQHHFDKKIAEAVCEKIKDAYVIKQLEKKYPCSIALEPEATRR